MELFSQPFIQAVRQALSTPGTVVLGTIPVPKGKPLALVEEIRTRKDVKVLSVSTPRVWSRRPETACGAEAHPWLQVPIAFPLRLEYRRVSLPVRLWS